MKNSNSPIFVKVYNRLEHFKKCIESLKICRNANESILYIASDAPSTNEDVENVEKIRGYIKTIKGFKEVIPIIRNENLGCIRDGDEAKKIIFEEHEKIIIMEDDVVVGLGFLEFMNYGLEKFQNDEGVIAIAGNLPIEINGKFSTNFLTNLFSPYGFATWKNKVNKINQLRKVENYKKWLFDKNRFNLFEKSFPESVRALPLIIDGGEILGDIEHNLIMANNNLYTLFPPMSISRSIGFDGSGLHCGTDKTIQNQVCVNNDYSKIEKKIIHKYNYSDIKNSNSNFRRFLVKILNNILYINMKYFSKIYFKPYIIFRLSYKKTKKIIFL